MRTSPHTPHSKYGFTNLHLLLINYTSVDQDGKNLLPFIKNKYGQTYRIKNVPNVYLSGFRKLKKKDLFRILDW